MTDAKDWQAILPWLDFCERERSAFLAPPYTPPRLRGWQILPERRQGRLL